MMLIAREELILGVLEANLITVAVVFAAGVLGTMLKEACWYFFRDRRPWTS